MSMNTIITSRQEADTIALAADIAAQLRSGDIILLEGSLGMGKSVMARSLIQKLTQQPDLHVPSPTFTLVQTYDTDLGPVWHFDLYRLNNPEEIYELGWEESFCHAVMIIEWPDRMGYLRPQQALTLSFQSGTQPDERIIQIKDTRHG